MVKKINQTEINSGYLNIKFPESFPFQKDEQFWIVTCNGKEKFLATRRTNTQITGLSKWFRANQVSDGTEIEWSYYDSDFINKKRVLRIEFLNNENNSDKLNVELEDLIIANLKLIDTDLTLYARQYCAGDGRISLLCLDKDKNFVVIKLKNKKTSDAIVGQIARHMGWVKENLVKDSNKKVKGLILAPETDYKLEYAVSVIPDVQVKYFNLDYYK